MYRSVYDYKTFYNSPMGLAVHGVLLRRIASFWPDIEGLDMLGCGYAVPYLEDFKDHARNVHAMMPVWQGADTWPKEGKNRVFLSNASAFPVENSCYDRILLVHYLENTDSLQSSLQEIWRVLKPNGRLLVIVPNRRGFWARGDWSPFGHGTPFSLSQVCYVLRDNLFVQEHTQGALFMPPFKSSFILKTTNLFERLGRSILPIVAGVHMIEASKQVYAGVDKGSGSKIHVLNPGILGGRGKGVPVPNSFTSRKQN